MSEDRIHAVYKAVNKPLTIAGADRRLFFGSLILGAATFNLLGSVVAGLALSGTLVVLARWATETDPHLLRVLLNAARFRTQYDPLKRDTSGIPRVVRA